MSELNAIAVYDAKERFKGIMGPGGRLIAREAGLGPTVAIAPLGNMVGGAALAAVKTWNIARSMPSRVVAARAHIGNIEASPPTGLNLSFALSTSSGAPYAEKPVGHNWYAGNVAGAATFNAPARVSATVPGWLTSDWTFFPNAPARTDGPGYALFTRFVPGGVGQTFSYFIPNGVNSTAADVDGAYQATLPVGEFFGVRRADGNFATPATADAWAGGVAQNNTPMIIIEVMLEDGGTMVLHSADSIAAGQGSAGGIAGSVDLACSELRSEGHNILSVNRGLPGQTSGTYSGEVMALLPILRPPVLVYCPLTINDFNPAAINITQALIDAEKARAGIVYMTARANGAKKVIFETGMPINALTTYGGLTQGQRVAMEALRLQMRSWVLSLAWDGLDVVDYEPFMSDGGNPAQYKAGLSDDGVHPNLAGQLVRKAIIKRALRQAIG